MGLTRLDRTPFLEGESDVFEGLVEVVQQKTNRLTAGTKREVVQFVLRGGHRLLNA